MNGDDEIVELNADIGTTARAKVVQLQVLDKQLDKHKRQSAADRFSDQCRAFKLPAFSRETSFAAKIGRRWKFDFSWRKYALAVEIEGIVMRFVDGEWRIGGRHASISGFKEDCIKYNTAALIGWTVLRFEQSQVNSGHAIRMTMRVLARRGWKSPS